MHYKNAGELLPEHLLREVQKYAGGGILYVPKPNARCGWGEKNGSAAKYAERNAQIRSLAESGTPHEVIAERFYLSVDSIRMIIKSRDR